jgi:hypothetical protein
MLKPVNIPKRQLVLAAISKAIALLGLLGLGFLLARPAMPMPIGWIVLVVTVIQLSLSYSPKKRSEVNRVPLSLPVTEYRCRASKPFDFRNPSRNQ